MQNNYNKRLSELFNSPGLASFIAVFKRQVNRREDPLFVSYKNEGKQNNLTVLIAANDQHAFLENAVPDVVYDTHENAAFLKVVHLQKSDAPNAGSHVWKRRFDVVFSLVLMLLGFPVFAILYLITKFSSRGPAFFKQERVGKHGKKFHIYKFRSMYTDAEKFGPALSRADDPRITKWGRIIRRTRLDELPQFWNVLKGDMAIVGPRPERSYFIEKIVEVKPDYHKLHLIKPGITSMGQVYYGYAENVDQMCMRMEYDLIYLQQVNLTADIRIIAKTVRIMFEAKGK